MSKELVAFERIKKMYIYFINNYREIDPFLMICEEEDLNTIETTLKENEHLKIELLGQSQELNIKNKVLEIIKEKPTTFYLAKTCDNYDDYLSYALEVDFIENCYTKEEYDLLKEVLV